MAKRKITKDINHESILNTTKANKSKLDDFKEFCGTKPKDIVFQNKKKQSKFQLS